MRMSDGFVSKCHRISAARMPYVLSAIAIVARPDLKSVQTARCTSTATTAKQTGARAHLRRDATPALLSADHERMMPAPAAQSRESQSAS